MRSGAALLIAGAVTFLAGAAIGVPRVFTEPDPARRLRMLTDRPRAWRVAQPLYALGPILSAAGVGLLAVDAGSALLAASCWALALAAAAWAVSVALRTARVPAFAAGTLPRWPFTTSVWLTLVGIALLGLGLPGAGLPGWSRWAVLAATLVITAAHLRFGDMPPFVFALLFLLVGAVAA